MTENQCEEGLGAVLTAVTSRLTREALQHAAIGSGGHCSRSRARFTEALIATPPDSAAYGAYGKLSISELDENLTTRVEELTEGKQTPVMTKPGAIKRYFLTAL